MSTTPVDSVLTLPPGVELDLAFERVVFGQTGPRTTRGVAVPFRSWSTDDQAIDVLYHPLHKSEDWDLAYDYRGGNRSWAVYRADGTVVASGVTPTVAKARAVYLHHLAAVAAPAEDAKKQPVMADTARAVTNSAVKRKG